MKIWIVMLRGSRSARIASSSGSYSTAAPLDAGTSTGGGNGDQLLAGRFLEERRTELRIEKMRDVEDAGFVKLHHLGRNLVRLVEADVADARRLIELDDLAREQASDDRTALAADQVEENLLALCLQFERLVARAP